VVINGHIYIIVLKDVLKIMHLHVTENRYLSTGQVEKQIFCALPIIENKSLNINQTWKEHGRYSRQQTPDTSYRAFSKCLRRVATGVSSEVYQSKWKGKKGVKM
jgi:hypothetical protein